ncbi:hypothetical protein E2C01_063975 [Portunus trituberculatus]|uniref:Uncharacterized protein n=1 Tax=Portunus trituberculatus TaxID=210409 RepID=A0A5B7HMI7_PORTR|nr:hypothetical protein [Portunus trituberculatus]
MMPSLFRVHPGELPPMPQNMPFSSLTASHTTTHVIYFIRTQFASKASLFSRRIDVILNCDFTCF